MKKNKKSKSCFLKFDFAEALAHSNLLLHRYKESWNPVQMTSAAELALQMKVKDEEHNIYRLLAKNEANRQRMKAEQTEQSKS